MSSGFVGSCVLRMAGRVRPAGRRTVVTSSSGGSRESAAAVIIGDEILTGKTLDTNTNFLAKFLFNRGVQLRRVEVIPDDVEEIGESVRRLSEQFDYVFTSGGIGPTHDDVTYEAIAKAYGLKLVLDPEVASEMKRISPNQELNDSRLRMATLPSRCEKLLTDGLWVPLVVVNGNIYILPGVPIILEKMVHAAASRFGSGNARARAVVYTRMVEGDLASSLAEIAKSNPMVSIGSYPRTKSSDPFSVKITVEGDEAQHVSRVAAEISVAINGTDDVARL